MILSEFKTELKGMLKRGDSLDDQLQGFIRRAVRWIESNYTLQYMRKVMQIDVEGDSTEVVLPRIPIKTVEFVQFPSLANADGKIPVARKGEIGDTEWGQLEAGYFPGIFYLDGAERLIFNGLFGTDVQGNALMVLYSSISDASGASHWLFDNAEGLLLVQAAIEAATWNRDERTLGLLRSQRDEHIRTLLNADYEARYAGQDIFIQP